MISTEDEAKIRRLYVAEGWKVGTIARQLGFHHSTVERVLAHSGLSDAVSRERPTMIEPYLPFVREKLEQYPTLPASRLFEMVKKRGYPGGPDHFRHLVALYRPRPEGEAYLRLRTWPGEQAQVDWAHFGRIKIGRALRPLMAFVMVLSWSRQVFLRFYPGQGMANFLRGHVAAFIAWGGVARVLLYDNLKSAVLERHGDAIRFHPTLLSLAGHYCFEPRPVAVARGNEKGRVERAIRYARDSFFAGRQWRDLDDLNAQAEEWCWGIAGDRRCPQEKSLRVREAFEQEREKLLALPANPYPTEERVAARVGKTPYVRFDLNDYSVPHTCVRQTLTVLATPEKLRVLDGKEVVATHPRSYSRDEQIEDKTHIEALEQRKRRARKHRGLDRLRRAAPSSQKLLEQLAERGGNLGSATAALLRLLDTYSSGQLEAAIREALEKGSPRPHSVRLVLERTQSERGEPAPLPVRLPEDQRLRELVVRPHSLATYDHLNEEDEDESED